MPPASPLRSRLEDWFRRAPIPALRDVVAKQPSAGHNLDALDGIRGLAVLIVVASHADGLHMKGHGAVGVWLFFALSAFLLTLPFAADPTRVIQGPQLRKYVVRRLLRILPAYYFAIVVVAYLSDFGFDFVWQHFRLARAAGIFWTIPQEMLFYVVLPLLVALHLYVFRRHSGATLIGLAAIALLANTSLTAGVFALPGNDKLLPFHLGIFVTGMGFAFATHTPALTRAVANPTVNRALDGLGLVMLVLLILTAPYFVERLATAAPWLGPIETRLGLRYPGCYGVLCGVLVYVTRVCEGRLTHRILSSLALRTLGIVSFSLYLFHIVMQNALLRMWHGLTHGSMLFLCNLFASFLVAVVVYSLVERPCLRIGRNWPARSRRGEVRGG